MSNGLIPLTKLGQPGGASPKAMIRWGCILLSLAIVMAPLAAMASFKPPKRGVPGRREGGGSRNPCIVAGRPQLSYPITLLPDLKEANKVAVGQTLDPYPRFFWYLPATRAGEVEFTLYTDATPDSQKVLYQTRFQPNRQQGKPSPAGIYSLALPTEINLPPLEVGKTYRWSVELICPNVRKGSIMADGGVERVAVDSALQASLQKANWEQQATVYVTNGLWFNALNVLAHGRSFKNDAYRNKWKALLSDPNVNLAQLADIPFVQDDRGKD